MTLAQVITSICMIGGCSLTLVAAIGIVRFPDLLSRMHAATKPQVLGLILLMTGLAVGLGSSEVTWKVVLVVVFQLITAPVAAHMVARAGYRTGKIRSDLLMADEFTEDLDRAQSREDS
ncbi:monovalent cation/H(+) antiporter subunit G [Ruania suaedae]|uniref:monovalent cation/H(+) antiporter subunit G n=1 Tax=Ruania suaedae TaxID=2897774 RepID=UPI001E5D4C15|nr:monovalent cation/H(+) antiporter subunit G [Ruania suaedae]UFU02761.1 monovalent cation/H(+) antiporter subunit G [Ruania suaedae]